LRLKTKSRVRTNGDAWRLCGFLGGGAGADVDGGAVLGFDCGPSSRSSQATWFV
jgi:hypothetical protein